MKMLLHVCCGSCGFGFLDGWMVDGESKPDLLWYNPNIHPFVEHKERKNAAIDFADKYGLDVIKYGNYGLDEFLNIFFELKNEIDDDKNLRCKMCYEIRMNFAAAKAAELNYTAFSTTLLASPWQKFEMICQAGEAAAKANGLQFIIKDYRKNYNVAKQKAREMRLYMQKYCGCIFSEQERYAPKKKHNE
ncbi:MAG: epoxyqueuosine reductase QueH [Defluviitaleaceae bacterium]|nr:epoxyqueuosine reductase QueH [Defluviitaleaceae bacterium]